MPKAIKAQIKAKPTTSSRLNNFPVEYYSASSIIQFATNPIMFKIKYVNRDRFDTATNASAVLGQSFHHALEVYYGGSDTLIPTNESEAIEYGLKSGLDYIDKYNEGFINFSKTIPNKQKLFDLLSFTFTSYVQQMPYVATTVFSVEDEIKESIDIEWRGKKLRLPVPMKGRIDRTDRVEDKLKIVDYKTCYQYSKPEKIDGKKIIQAVTYYLLSYVKHGIEPYSVTYQEVKYTKNSDGSPQVKEYEMVFADNELYFDFFFRFYEDITRALNGEQVYVPNLDTFYDNEIGIIAYIHRLDIPDEVAKQLKEHKVSNITDLLKKEMHSAGNMKKLLKTIEEQFVSAKSIDYDKMKTEEQIQTKMMEHGMMLQFDSVVHGASVDLYRYMPSIGLKMSRLKGYVSDVEQVTGFSGVRILAPIPNSTMVGFEVPRETRRFPALPNSVGFDIAIGEDVMGNAVRFDLRTAPHVIVAGSTGAGKSVFLNNTITQLIGAGAELHLYDPKKVELSQYQGRVAEYQDNLQEITKSLAGAVAEMHARYDAMKAAGVKNIKDMSGGNYKFYIIDEFAELAMGGEVGQFIQSIAQLGRAAGMHLIIATQRASTKIINGDTKTNFPVKVVFKMAKEVDSRVMLDEGGAEKLLGKGDMIFASDAGVMRLQAYSD